MLAGCDVYMTRPVSFKTVAKLLDEWEAQKLAPGPSSSPTTPAEQ